MWKSIKIIVEDSDFSYSAVTTSQEITSNDQLHSETRLTIGTYSIYKMI